MNHGDDCQFVPEFPLKKLLHALSFGRQILYHKRKHIGISRSAQWDALRIRNTIFNRLTYLGEVLTLKRHDADIRSHSQCEERIHGAS